MKYLNSELLKLTAASILVIALSACGGAEDRKEKYLEKGKAYLNESNYDKARLEFKNVLQIDPKYAEAYFYMGQLSEENKDFKKSITNYRKAIELNPKYTLSKIKLSRIYVVAGTESFINEAKKLLIEINNEEPGNSEAALISATIEYKTGNKKKAVADLESVVKSDKNLVQGIGLLSTVYIVNGDEAKAIDLLSKGVADNPDAISLKLNLAKILTKNKEYLKAEKYLKQAIDIDPDKYSLKLALASFYASSGQTDKAESVLRAAIEQDDEDIHRYLMLVEMLVSKVSVQRGEDELSRAVKNKPDLYELKFALIKLYKKMGKSEAAKESLKKIIEEKSFNNEGLYARALLADYLFEEGEYGAAKSYVSEIIAEYPNNNEALLIKGKLALLDFNTVDAINSLRTVIKNDPKNAKVSLLLAQAHELNSESELAESELKRAIESNPVNDQVHVNYVQYLVGKGRVDEAASVADKALVYFKDSYDLMNLKLKIVASKGMEVEVVALLNRMEQADSTKADVNIMRGQYYLSKKEVVQALKQFEIGYNKSHDKYKPLQLIVRTYMSNKQPDKAIDRLQKNLDTNPDDAVANLIMGNIYLNQKKMIEARDKFSQSLKADESWFLPYKSLADSYLIENKFNKALDVYQNAINELKVKSPAQLQVAAIYEFQKEPAKAMEIYESILAENSFNRLAANNYASLLLDHGSESDMAKAFELVKGFEKIKKPAIQDTLGWAYAKTGDNVKAVEILKLVVSESPEIAIFRYHLGYALYQMGDKTAAKSHFEIAVSSGQKFTGKDKAAELLKSM